MPHYIVDNNAECCLPGVGEQCTENRQSVSKGAEDHKKDKSGDVWKQWLYHNANIFNILQL